jgi:hypothetical protein
MYYQDQLLFVGVIKFLTKNRENEKTQIKKVLGISLLLITFYSPSAY